MSSILSIWHREFKDYFVTPIAYLVIAIFLLVTGWFFFSTFFLKDQANLRDFFQLLPLTFSFVIPALTMRLLSEEFQQGSYELLITMPVNVRDIILGKFLASCSVIVSLLLPTLAYPITIHFLGDLDWGPVIGGYIGALFLGASFSAIGLLTSSLTRNQIIAFILGTLICFGLSLLDNMLVFFPKSILEVLQYLGAGYHFQNIAKGILDSRDILYFLSLMFVGLYLTSLTIQARE
jgi:ABC-2 type transport system permease protein